MSATRFETGECVQHPAWGICKIVAVEDQKLTLILTTGETKKLALTAGVPLQRAAAADFEVLLPQRQTIKVKAHAQITSRFSHDEAKELFLERFPLAFVDPRYYEEERSYKAKACHHWEEHLNREHFRHLLDKSGFDEIVHHAVDAEARTLNLLDPFAKAALHSALRREQDKAAFSNALFDLLHGPELFSVRFERFGTTLDTLPRPGTSIYKWPAHTIFPFLANPKAYLFVKPRYIRLAASRLKFSLAYSATPTWSVYENILEFAEFLKRDLRDWQPEDFIDIQSFIYVTGRIETNR